MGFMITNSGLWRLPFLHFLIPISSLISRSLRVFPVGAPSRYAWPELGSCLQTAAELWLSFSWLHVLLEDGLAVPCAAIPLVIRPSVHQAPAGVGSQKGGQVGFPAVPWPLQSQLVKWW